LAGSINQQRIADELISHRFATGNVPIDVRSIALAITKFGCLKRNSATNKVTSLTPTPLVELSFFDSRNGMKINEVFSDTERRADPAMPEARSRILPRRKADIEKLNLDRTGDFYLRIPKDTEPPEPMTNGLIQQYGAATSAGTDISLERLRQEVFRRPNDLGKPDTTVMGGIYVDREYYSDNTEKVALYRYFLEPLGVSVDKWSMNVRGRSRAYNFADVFDTYLGVFRDELKASLTSDPVPGLTDPDDCDQLINAANFTVSSLPPADGPGAIPTYTDVQRIFNKSCVECHGGLDYPPYQNKGSFLDLSEDEDPPAGKDRLDRSIELIKSAFISADPSTSYLYQRITDTTEDCPFGLMPCGGPPLSKVDIETIRRWIVGGGPNTRGDPHILTIDGLSYDFQSAGEFVLLRGHGLEVQARQTAVGTAGPLDPNPHTGLSSCVSVNTAAAVRVGGHRITYQPNLGGQPDPDGLQLRIDGRLSTVSNDGIPLASGGRIVRTAVPGGIQIEAPGGTVVAITPNWWDYYQMWYLDISVRHARATQGVMGAVPPGDWLPALPDGTRMGPKPSGLRQRYLDLYETFENAWRVDDATTLFDYAPGTSTSTFTVGDWPEESPEFCTAPLRPPGGPLARPPHGRLPLEVARQYCRAVIEDHARANCEQDVMVTGEPGFAQSYLRGEQVERNVLPSTPVLELPARFETGVATPVVFTWNRTSFDLDGDPLTYRHCVWEVTERFTFNKCVIAKSPGSVCTTLGKRSSYLEPGKAYYWKVIAEDGKGGTVESETRRFETQ
jgi:hypothetical protein